MIFKIQAVKLKLLTFCGPNYDITFKILHLPRPLANNLDYFTYETGPEKTGHICTNYICLEKGAFLALYV